jgi:uncharacterized protein (DUF58 family)
MDIKAIEKAVAKIQTALFKNSNSFTIGNLKSHFRGSGLQFKEHQIYTHGDDVRFIDWKLMAKTSRPYIKTFEEERNVEIVVVLDLSLSMFVGHKDVSKLKVAIEVCALLYLLAKQSGDLVHVILVGEKIVNLPPKSGQEGLTLFVTQLQRLGVLNEDGNVNISYRPTNHIDEKRKYAEILRHTVRKKEVVLLTDFIDFLPSDGIAALSKKSNLHCFQIRSPLDKVHKHHYTIFGFNSGNTNYGNKGIFRVHTKDDEEKDLGRLLGKRLKKLDVDDRYLEQFIKEMT